MKKIILALFLSSGLIVSSAEAALLKILSTEPDTQVYEVTDPMNKKLLGRAPLRLDDFDTSQPRLLLLEKPGFSSSYIPFSQGVATHFAILATLRPIINWTSEELTRKTIETAEGIVDRITTIQSLLDSRKVKEAMPLAEALKLDYPNSFSVRLIYANTLLLNGEGKKAEILYSSLISEVPANRSSMKEAIEQIHFRLTGNRIPAATATGEKQ